MYHSGAAGVPYLSDCYIGVPLDVRVVGCNSICLNDTVSENCNRGFVTASFEHRLLWIPSRLLAGAIDTLNFPNDQYTQNKRTSVASRVSVEAFSFFFCFS